MTGLTMGPILDRYWEPLEYSWIIDTPAGTPPQTTGDLPAESNLVSPLPFRKIPKIQGEYLGHA